MFVASKLVATRGGGGWRMMRVVSKIRIADTDADCPKELPDQSLSGPLLICLPGCLELLLLSAGAVRRKWNQHAREVSRPPTRTRDERVSKKKTKQDETHL